MVHGSTRNPAKLASCLLACGLAWFGAFGADGLAQNCAEYDAYPAIGERVPLSAAVEGVETLGEWTYAAMGDAGIAAVRFPGHQIVPWDTPGEATGLDVVGDIVYVADGGSGLRLVDFGNESAPYEIGAFNTAGWSEDVQVLGGIAYVADGGRGLMLLDVTAPASPTFVGRYALTAGYARGVQVVTNLAYVAAGSDGLHLVDISDPTTPVRLARIPLTGIASAVDVEGNYAYVASQDGGLHIVDVSQPTAPAWVATLATEGSAMDVDVTGNRAVVADGSNGVLLVDVSDPSDPKLLARTPSEDESLGLASTGPAAWIADGAGGLVRVDLYGPVKPAMMQNKDVGGVYVRAVEQCGNYALVAETTDWNLKVFDVSDPTLVQEVSETFFNCEPFEMITSGQYVFVGDFTGGLEIYDLRNPNDLQVVGRYQVGSVTFDMDLEGNYAYLANHDKGLLIVDVSDLAHPTLVGTVANDQARCVEVYDGKAYLGTDNRGLVVIDVTDPTAPVVLAEWDYHPVDIEAFGHYLYLAEDNVGLVVLDVRNLNVPYEDIRYILGDPTDLEVEGQTAVICLGSGGATIMDTTIPYLPEIVGRIDAEDQFTMASVNGRYVMLSDGTGGLKVVDLCAWPLIGRAEPNDWPQDVAAYGDYAIAACDDDGLVVIDLAGSPDPVIVGTLDLPGQSRDVLVEGDLAYVAGTSGLFIVNLANPLTPTLVGSTDAAGSLTDVYVTGSYAFATAGTHGLQVIDVSNPESPTPVGSMPTSGNAVALSGNFYSLQIADSGNGLLYVSIADPEHPSVMQTLPISAGLQEISEWGTVFYVATDAGLQVVHSPFPNFGSLGALIEVPGWATDVAVSPPDYLWTGDSPGCAYVACWNAGMQVYDLADPSQPRWIGGVDTPYSARRLAPHERGILIADRRTEVQFVSRQCGDLGDRSFAEIAYGDSASVCNVPNGTGKPLNRAFPSPYDPEQPEFVDATISVGVPTPFAPAEDISLGTGDGGLVSCADGAIADGPADGWGLARFSGPLRAGGHSDLAGRERTLVYYLGQPLNEGAGIDLYHNSPDINGDLIVNLSDVAIFATDYWTSPVQYRSNFNFDLHLNLVDIVAMAQGVGATCPGKSGSEVAAGSLGGWNLAIRESEPAGEGSWELLLTGVTSPGLVDGWEIGIPSELSGVRWTLDGQTVEIEHGPRLLVGLKPGSVAVRDGTMRLARFIIDDGPTAVRSVGDITAAFRRVAEQPLISLTGGAGLHRVAWMAGSDGQPGAAGALDGPLLTVAPNPANPLSRIRFRVDREADVKLVIFDLAGRSVRVLQDGPLQPGLYTRIWLGRGDGGNPVASGTYFCRMTIGGRQVVEPLRITLVK